MAKGVVFNGSNDITYLIGDSEDTAPFFNRADVLLSPDFSPVAGFDFKYWRRNGNALELKTQVERDAIDSAEAAGRLAAYKAIAGTIKDQTSANGVQWRAFALMLLDEFNTIRQWLAASKTGVNGAATFAAFKTAWAALPATPDRTIAQVKTAYQNKIDAGSAD